MSEDAETKEYYTLVDIVREYDQRILTVKGWGVTLSLAALALGFQYQHYGLFLVACVSGIAFWTIEGLMKRFQTRYYVRMREIEVVNWERVKGKVQGSSPQIDWSWTIAPDYFLGKITGAPPPPKRHEQRLGYNLSWLAPHVFLPHLISVVVGGVLFMLGMWGKLPMPL